LGYSYFVSTSNPEMPSLYGKGERSHRTDDLEFYQLLTYVDDVNINKNRENYYNFDSSPQVTQGKNTV
jgi:hypothetical protein